MPNPFPIKASLPLSTNRQTLEGLIDIVVMEDRLWFILLETKRYGFSVMQALPQTLTYMMSNPITENLFKMNNN